MTTYTAPPTQIHLVLNNGDTLNVNDHGLASGTMNNGGVENVYSGGTDSGATINSGGGNAGLENVYGVATDTTINRGLEIVFSGGTATHTTINSGGQLWVSGVAIDTTINNGGIEQVLGGTADNVTFGGPHAILALAGKPSGLIGTISNWLVGDVIVFLNTVVTSVQETGNNLTVTWGDNQKATYTVASQQANAEFKLVHHGHQTDLILAPLDNVGHHNEIHFGLGPEHEVALIGLPHLLHEASHQLL